MDAKYNRFTVIQHLGHNSHAAIKAERVWNKPDTSVLCYLMHFST